MGLPWWLPFGSVPEIDARTLADRLAGAEPPQLLDVRTANEFRAQRIEGSVLVPIAELQARIATLGLSRDRTVVAVCAHARRSIPAVRLLQRAGYRDVLHLQAGLAAWIAAGLPVTRD